MTPAELLAAARAMVHEQGLGVGGVRFRAAALLGRQALEGSLVELWDRRAPRLREASMRSQLLCLPAYCSPEVAGATSHAWYALSDACHYHPYELAPTAEDLEGWLDGIVPLSGQRQSERPT